MPFSEKEMLEDLHKVRVRKYVYLLGGLGVLALTVALVVMFFARRDWPALLLAAVGAFWSVILFYHAYRTRQLEHLIGARLKERRAGEAVWESLEEAEEPGEGGAPEPSGELGDSRAPGGGAPDEP